MTTIPTEKDVQRSVKQVLEYHGWKVSDLSQPRASMQTPGIPDLYCQHPKLGHRIWVEVKRPGGRVTDAQLAWKDVEMESGGLVLYPESGEEMHEYLVTIESYGARSGEKE